MVGTPPDAFASGAFAHPTIRRPAGRGSAVWLHSPKRKDRRHDEPGAERPDDPHRAEGPVRETDADVLAAGGAGRRVAGAAPGQGNKTAGRGSGAVSRGAGTIRPDRAALRASRRRPRVRAAGEWRPALRVPWLAVRRVGPMPRNARRAERLG